MTITDKTFCGLQFNTELDAARTCVHLYATACGHNTTEETLEWMESIEDPNTLRNEKDFVNWCCNGEEEENKEYVLSLCIEQWQDVIHELKTSPWNSVTIY